MPSSEVWVKPKSISYDIEKVGEEIAAGAEYDMLLYVAPGQKKCHKKGNGR